MKLGVWLVSAVAFATTAYAQTAPAPVPPTTGAPPEAPVGQPGMRMVTGQAPVVGGNAAGARERALDDAIRQAVDQALAELVDAPTRAARAKEMKALLAKARSFVPRYRTLEEGEVGGNYTLRLEADVDEVALRRRIERWSAATPPPATTAPPGAQRLLLVAGDRLDGTAAFVPALAGALGGARAVAAAPTVEPTPGAAVQAAARGGLTRAALVSAAAEDEGALRGTGKTAVACRATIRVYAAPAATLVGERQLVTRAFVDHAADQPTAGRNDCFGRLAGEVRGALDGVLAGGARSDGELGALTIDAALIEPAAVPALLKSVRAVGTVSSAEIQRMAAGHVELRVRTRAEPAGLAAALSRDVDPMITLTDVRASGDVIHLQARLRAPVNAGSTQ